MTNNVGVVALGPIREGHKSTGGARRFKSSVDALRVDFEDVLVCSRFINVLRTVRKCRIYYAFDERYLLLAVLPFFLGRKIIFFPRGNKIITFRENYGPKKLIVYKFIFSILYRMCSLMVFQTSAQAEEFRKTYKFKCNYKILPNNIKPDWLSDCQFNRTPPKIGVVRVGFCGNNSKNKGLDFLYSSIREDILEGRVELHLAGDLSFDERIGVVTYGYVSDIRVLLKNIDVLVIPSIYDSFPNVLMEGMFYEVPVFVSRNEMTAEILYGGSSVLLFDREERVLNKKINCFFDDMDKYIEAVSVTRSRYDFSWGEKFSDIIKSVLT